VINFINNAVSNSVKHTLGIDCLTDTPAKIDQPKPNAFMAYCALNGLHQECHFLISIPKHLVMGFMHQLVELQHAGLDHNIMMVSIVSEIGNLASCELSVNQEVIDKLGPTEVSTPSVWQWTEGEFTLPVHMDIQGLIHLQGHPIHTFMMTLNLDAPLEDN
jgi:hypothetical protein